MICRKKFDLLSSKIGAIENLTEEIIRNINRLEKDKIKLNRIVFKQASTLLASIKESSIENSHVVNAFRIINRIYYTPKVRWKMNPKLRIG